MLHVRDDRETPLERDGMILSIAVSTRPSSATSENQKLRQGADSLADRQMRIDAGFMQAAWLAASLSYRARHTDVVNGKPCKGISGVNR